MSSVHRWSAPLAIVLAGGCGHSPPQELLSARTAYDQASRGPAATLAPADVHTAAETLNAAEASYDREGPSQDTKDIAYAAERRAQIAEVRADAIRAQYQRDALLAQIGEAQAAELQRAKDALLQANAQLAAQQAQTRDAEVRAAAATALLAHVASVRREQRNVIITLSGSVLFASGKAELLPDAQSRLAQVAAVLTRDPTPNPIAVRGYTDSVGSPSANQQLSQRRADAVRDYLAMHGVSGDRLTSQGFGAADPIADNASPEGRANNRRVEIVIQPSDSTGTGGGGTNEPPRVR